MEASTDKSPETNSPFNGAIRFICMELSSTIPGELGAGLPDEMANRL